MRSKIIDIIIYGTIYRFAYTFLHIIKIIILRGALVYGSATSADEVHSSSSSKNVILR